MKIKAHQRAILAETIIYAFGRRLKALNRLEVDSTYLEPIPFTKIRARHKRADQRIVLEGLNVWLEKVERGFQGRCGMWKVRSEARLEPTILEFLRQLYSRNIEHFKLLKASINAKDGKVIEVTTSFEFESEDEAAMFMELIGPLLT